LQSLTNFAAGQAPMVTNFRPGGNPHFVYYFNVPARRLHRHALRRDA
jgi:hypothetical protein